MRVVTWGGWGERGGGTLSVRRHPKASLNKQMKPAMKRVAPLTDAVIFKGGGGTKVTRAELDDGLGDRQAGHCRGGRVVGGGGTKDEEACDSDEESVDGIN
jgi:hypothetical protein